jgi:hypothetical protein
LKPASPRGGFWLDTALFPPLPPLNIRTNTRLFSPLDRPKIALCASLSMFSSDDPQISPKEENGSTTSIS